MLYTKQPGLQPAGNNQQTTSLKPKRVFLKDFSAKEIKEAMMPLGAGNCPVEELIAVGEAVFEFINSSEMELRSKNAFLHLEKLFVFYKNLIGSGDKNYMLVKKQ